MSVAVVEARLAAAVYVRISRDGEGDELGVKRQERDCRELCGRKGWQVVEVFADNDISASGYSKKRRPSFDSMMGAVEAGAVDVIVAWDLDRLSRRPAEAEAMWATVIDKGARVVTCGGDDIDASGEGLMGARIKMAVAAEEVRKMSKRIRRKQLQLAEDGKPVGLGAAQPFGYEGPVYAPGNPKPVIIIKGGMVVNEEEAAILRQAAADVLLGVPFTSIAKRWNEAGVRNPFPRKTRQGWRANSVKALLISPRPAGLRRHREDGQIVLYPAAWPAILDRVTHDRLVAVLGSKGVHVPRRRTLLTGLCRCGKCGATMNRNTKGGRAVIECPHGPGYDGCNGVSMGADLVEATVVRRVTLYIEERAAAGVDRIVAEGAEGEAAGVAAELAQAEAFKLKLAEQLGRGGDFDAEEIAVMRRANKERITELRARLDSLTERTVLARWDTVEAFQAEFEAVDTDTRRALLAQIVDHVTIAPYAGKRRDAGRVAVTFR